MPSAISSCQHCGNPGRWGVDDDWCHETLDDALSCPLEGWDGQQPVPLAAADTSPRGDA
jgi:hypothetical protein